MEKVKVREKGKGKVRKIRNEKWGIVNGCVDWKMEIWGKLEKRKGVKLEMGVWIRKWKNRKWEYGEDKKWLSAENWKMR